MTPDLKTAQVAESISRSTSRQVRARLIGILGFGVALEMFAACGGRVPSNTEPPEVDTFLDDAGSDRNASIPVVPSDAPIAMTETHDAFSDASADRNVPQLDFDAQVQISDAYFPYWVKAIGGGSPDSELAACNDCVFDGSHCDFPYFDIDCNTGTLCIFEHCSSTTDGTSLWDCVESCFRIGSPCVPQWNAYMACTVQACATVCP